MYTVFATCGQIKMDFESLVGQTLGEVVEDTPLEQCACAVGRTEASATRLAAYDEFDSCEIDDCPPARITFVTFEVDGSERILRLVGERKKKLTISREVTFSWGDDFINFEL